MKVTNILKSIRKLNESFNGNNQKLYKTLIDEIEKKIIKKEEDLINKIANHYNLNVEEIRKKFIYKKRKSNLYKSLEPNLGIETEESKINMYHTPLLYKIILNNIIYYIECVENGKVYDVNKNIIGIFKNNDIILNI